MGTQKLTLRFDQQEYRDIVRIPVDSYWAASEERCSTHAGLEFHGGHLVDSWVASDQVRALNSGEAQLYGIVDGSARGIFTCTRRWDEPSTSMSRRTRRQRSGCAPERALERPDTSKVDGYGFKTPFVTKVVRLRKVKGTEKEPDMGTKELDGPTHQRILQKLPLMPTQCRRPLGLIATANGGSVVKARMSGNEETSEKFSAQVMIVMRIALATWILMDVLRQKTQLEATAWERLLSEAHRLTSILSIRSRFRQTCTVLQEVNAITRRGSAKG